MAYEVKMPKFGETMVEGVVMEWLIKEGEKIEKGEPLLIIETDKSVLEVESETDGQLRKIVVKEGETVPIGTLVALIADEGEDISAYDVAINEDKSENKPEGQPEDQPGGEEIPGIGEKNPVKEENISIIEKNVDKEINNGKVRATPAARRTALEEGIELQGITGSGPGGAIKKDDVIAVRENKGLKATPVARKIAKEYGLDLQEVNIKTSQQRITKEDVLKHLESDKSVSQEMVSSTGAEPLSGIRKVIADRMSVSYREAPHVTINTRVDMTALMDNYKQLKELVYKQAGVKLSLTDIIIKVAASTLKAHPQMNARFINDKLELVKDANIGLAVAVEKGLIVPVIRNSAGLNLAEIARERHHLIDKARQGKLTPEEMSGGSFTITNLGAYDIEFFNPIINPPEVGILGIGTMKEEVVVVDGELEIRSLMWASLSFDHRINDGVPAAKFLKELKDKLENSYLMLL